MEFEMISSALKCWMATCLKYGVDIDVGSLALNLEIIIKKSIPKTPSQLIDKKPHVNNSSWVQTMKTIAWVNVIKSVEYHATP